MVFLFIKAFFLLLCFYTRTAFRVFDAQPLILKTPTINLTAAQMEEVLNMDPIGEYSTMKFQYEHDQYSGQYTSDYERCHNDHVRCLTSILSASRPVCGVSFDGRNRTGFGSLCDLFLANCLMSDNYWAVLDTGNCNAAAKIFIYDPNDLINQQKIKYVVDERLRKMKQTLDNGLKSIADFYG